MALSPKRCAPAAALVLLLALPCGAWAGAPTERLHDAFTAVNRLLGTPELQDKPAELLEAIRGVVDDSFDFREAARLALGREWETLTETERAEFVRLFADLLEHGYVSGLAARARVQGGLTVDYRGEAVDGERAAVTTGIVGRDGGEIPVEYRMLRGRERWAVYDVLIDGVSLVENYRAQFARVMRRSSYGELVAQMRARASDAPIGPVTAGGAAAGAPAPPRPSPATTDAPAPAGNSAGRAPATSPPPRAAPVRTTSYWIQVGAFRNPSTAGGVAAHLLEKNLPVTVDWVAVHRGPAEARLSRVRVGPFFDRAEATAQLRDLRTNGYQPFLALERR